MLTGTKGSVSQMIFVSEEKLVLVCFYNAVRVYDIDTAGEPRIFFSIIREEL